MGMRKRFSIFIAIVLLLGVGIGVYFALPNIFASVVAPLPDEYKGLIQDNARKYNVDSCLIAALINGESRWAPKARSNAGAQGLMQIIPSTANSISRVFNISYSPSKINEAATNIEIGTALTRYNLDHYGSLRNILVAYNAGGGRVRLANNQLPRETQFYITKISRYYELYANLYPDFCTGPSLIGRPINATSTSNTPDLPDFTAPPEAPSSDLKIENFWKSLLPQ
jgi:soluble lytic murein transglycosylase